MARTAGSFGGVTGPRVRESALRLFARHGYAAVSMRQIAADVGVQAGALYNYIPDKQTLLFDLMHAHMGEVIDSWRAEPKGTGPMRELEAFARFHVRFHLDRPEAVFVANMELRNLEPGNLAVILAQRKSYEAALADILSRARATGQVDVPDVKVASYAVIGMLTGVYRWYREGGRLSRDEVVEMYWQMTRAAVGAARIDA